MRLVSVNVGRSRELFVPNAKKPGATGIFKTPAAGPVSVHRLGVADDFIGDLEHHGGPDQAVYLYGADDYAWWSARLGEVLDPGTFGENLTLGASLDDARIGDRFEIGEVLLEVTAPRIPCGTLATRMNDVGFVKTFREARKPGAYARVLREGALAAGDAVTFRPAPDGPRLVDVYDLWFDKSPDPARLREVLRAPVAERLRAGYEEFLATRA